MVEKIISDAEKSLQQVFQDLEDIALKNQEKVLQAFQKNSVALRHFNSTTGYGYDDAGRDTLNRVYADVFHAQSALVSPAIANGTHAISICLYAVLRPNDTLLSITDKPYDTITEVIEGKDIGSLKDFHVNFASIPLINNQIDFLSVQDRLLNDSSVRVVFIQRSRGYNWRPALSILQIGEAIQKIKAIRKDVIVIVDNCYGEFVDILEPTDVGADLIAGSLIKNPGGGIAPTGGYIAGKEEYVDLAAKRLTTPSLGNEVGSYAFGYQYFYQGLFLAPHITLQALKGCILFAKVLQSLGYEVMPEENTLNDIICSVKLESEDKLIEFCRNIQSNSPIDSFVVPYPWDMPGYQHQVIMAAGAFVQGASIELSADGPLKPPYIAYIQGGLTYEHVKIALKQCITSLLKYIK